MQVLVTGATGFVGGLLVPRLLVDGHDVRCLVREPDRLDAPWRRDVEVVRGEVEREQAVFRAADGCDVAYYLVHGMQRQATGLVRRERAAAAGFRAGADLAGIRRVVYLGGLVDEEMLGTASTHLYARHQTGEELRSGGLHVTEIRTGIVLGAGSASFALLAAAARFPVALATTWSRSRTQPIAAGDLIEVLVAVLDDPRAERGILEIGGPEVTTYAELVARTRRLLELPPAPNLRLPYLPPESTATLAASAARVDPMLALGLLGSVRSDAVVTDDRGHRRYGHLVTTGVDRALRAALAGSGH